MNQQNIIVQLQKENSLLKEENYKLKSNRDLFRLILENASEYIWQLDVKGDLVYINNFALESIDIVKTASRGLNFNELIHPDEINFFTNVNEQVLLGVSKQFETRIQRKDGKYIDLAIQLVPVIDDGVITGTLSFGRDITDQIIAEDALLQRENYLSALNQLKKSLQNANPDSGYQQFVDILGSAANASRAYIFVNHTNEQNDLLTSQKAEYSAVGIKSQIDNPDLQNLEYKQFFSRWQHVLLKGDIIQGKVSEFPIDERIFFEKQDIKSVLIIPIIIENNFIGFVGFDNCVSDVGWDKVEQQFLRTAASDLAQFIEKNNARVKLQDENMRFQTTMDALDAVVYVADINNYELLYLNKKGKNLAGDIVGLKCYTSLQDKFTEPCRFCTNYLLIDKDGNPNEPYIWEFQNTITKRWYQCRDQAIRWTDGRLVRLEVAIDITEQRNTAKLLEQNLKHQKLISIVSSSFVGIFDIDNAVNNLLKLIGEYSGADRSYVFLFREDNIIMYNSYEWCVPGVKSIKKRLQNQDSNMFPWWMSKLNNNEPINIKDVSLMPDEAGVEKETLNRLGVKSAIQIPLNAYGKLIGFIGLGNDLDTTLWSEEIVEILRVLGEILANTLHSKEAEKEIIKARNFAENLLETANSIIVTLDYDANITTFNKFAEKITGYSKQEVVGKNWFDIFILESDKKTIPKVFKNILELIPDTSQHENTIVKKNGDQLLISWNNNTTHDSAGIVNGLLSIGVDVTERTKIQNSLIESEERLKTLFEAIPDAYYISDTRGKFIEGNRAAEDLIGYKKEELIGESLLKLKLLSSKDKLRASRILLNSLAYKGTSTGPDEFVLNRKDGKQVAVEIYTYPITIKKEKYILSIANDLTKIKKAEKAKRLSEEKYKSVIKSMDDMVFVLDKNNRFVSVNDETNRNLFQSKKDFIGKKHSEIMPKHVDDLFNRAIAKVKKGYTEEYEYHLMFNNKVGWFAIKISPLFNNGIYDGSVSVIRDITHRKKIEQNLQESQDRFKALSEATYEGIVFSNKGVIFDVNQALCDMLGYKYEDFIGKYSSTFVAPESLEVVKRNVAADYNKPYDVVVECKDGSSMHVELQGRMFEYKGKVSRVTAVRDISVRKKSEILLQRSKNDLENLNLKLLDIVREEVEKSRERDHMMIVQSKQAAMGEMIGSIAHQWRQPLNDIGLYIQSIQDSYEFGELTKVQMDDIVQKTMYKLEYMSQTIDDFRNFFRSDKNKVPFILSNSIKKTILLVDAGFKSNAIEFKLDLDTSITFNGYPNEFSQALLNILNNAKDVLVEREIINPFVEIILSKSQDKISIRIRNNGGKIRNEIIDKIFDPYFTTKPNQTGTGIGLYISKTIIERNMLGKLIAHNINNEIAEFVIYLYDI